MSDSDEAFPGLFGGDEDDDHPSTANYVSFDSYALVPPSGPSCSAGGTLEFHFSLRDSFTCLPLATFTSTVAFKQAPVLDTRQDGVASCVFHIGLVLLQWYWMGWCTERMDVAAGVLDEQQLLFWRDFYEEISGEYFMVNRLTFWGRLKLTCSAAPESNTQPAAPASLSDDPSAASCLHLPGGLPHQPSSPCSPAVSAYSAGVEPATGSGAEPPPLPAGQADVVRHVSGLQQQQQQQQAETGGRAAQASARRQECVLVPLGAGKDSLTLYEMLKASGISTRWFFLSGRVGEFVSVWRYAAVARASGDADVIVAEHEWDVEERWERARPARLIQCGHSWAALVAFVSTLAALRCGCATVCVGNDRSANEGNGLWQGREVNHQYDKGSAFEALLRAYVRNHVDPGITYFSGLSHLWELQIAERFARGPAADKYLQLFLSCNEPVGARWCGACAKCLFVCLLMAAFLKPTQVAGIFGDDLLENVCLLPTLHALAGTGVKPLDCVGTPREVRLACALAARQYDAQWPGHCPALLRAWHQSEQAAPGTAGASCGLLDPPTALPLAAGTAALSLHGGGGGVLGSATAMAAALDLGLLSECGDTGSIPAWLRTALLGHT